MRELKIIRSADPNYPASLREIPKAPPSIYCRGALPNDSLPRIAIVGTRRATPNGLALAKKLARDLAEAGAVIVSGLALGVDAAAHEGALEAGGATVAVLPTGLDRIYPDQNSDLAERIIASGGALISEYAPGSPSYKTNFLERNRIVSGLSLGIVVVESPEKSGALSTASHALDQNRDIFVVPGPIHHDNYKGSHSLIRAGARLVTSAAEILDDLNLEPVEPNLFPETSLPDDQLAIVRAIRASAESLSVDKIMDLTRMDISALNRNLTLLMLRGLIKESAGRYFV